MPSVILAGIPDPETARQLISETVPQIGPGIAGRARAQAEAIRPFLERRWPRGATTEAARLINDLISPVSSCWDTRMSHILVNFYPASDLVVRKPGGPANPRNTFKAFQASQQALQEMNVRSGSLSQASDRALRPVLNELHSGLIALADSLMTLPRPDLPPTQHPPQSAWLREGRIAGEVSEQLTERINEAVKDYEAAREAGWSDSWMPGKSYWAAHFAAPIGAFRMGAIFHGFTAAVSGLGGVESLSGSPGANRDPYMFSDYLVVATGIRTRIHSAYLAIAVNYLAEVLELMPTYAEASGQGKQPAPVVVHGNVGAINSKVNNSNVSVADTVTNIGTTIQAIADRGQTSAADAISALVEAIQQDSRMAEDLRAQLLDNVADIADATATPDEPRSLSRARAAMAAITTAAGTSSQLAQAVSTWHHVLGQF
ncbi:hypothetical protein [Streptomyces alanosinicus]|uniref:Uncharacterized protein n=1 Tax=Streptomyces alanosinicus TaxID=68171 RepID=A0A919D889_9ACTN|nr:hypothetical protein [Streptomyces alanosinicus]GHE16014.1 hypothetical protein GCM10010339_92520 [Streptomyces alanosinicus]